MSRGDLSVRPIGPDDLPQVSRFLAENFPPDSPAEEWAAAWQDVNGRPGSEAPNHGMALWSGSDLVGAYCAIYSTRLIGGRVERFCNLAVWCVQPRYRSASVRMLRALLAQGGYHFTDLAPSQAVQRLNLRLGFQYLPSGARVVPNLPWTSRSKNVRVSSDPQVIAQVLTGESLRYYEDHANCRWARHTVLLSHESSCYVLWRFEKRKHVRGFAAVQYVSDSPFFRSAVVAFSRHLLVRHRALFTLVDDRVAGGPIKPSVGISRAPRKMFKSPTMNSGEIDYLYSEITAAP